MFRLTPPIHVELKILGQDSKFHRQNYGSLGCYFIIYLVNNWAKNLNLWWLFSIGVTDLYLCNECLEHKERQGECFTQMFS